MPLLPEQGLRDDLRRTAMSGSRARMPITNPAMKIESVVSKKGRFLILTR
jgi:hypothetical protein